MFLWQLELFGDLRLFHDSQDRVRLRTRKTEALLAYLALFPNAPHTREHLAGLLWETSGTREARNSLSVALHALRTVLESKGPTIRPVVLADYASLRLDSALLVTDVSRFEQAVRDSRAATSEERRLVHLHDALACYQGPLLPAFYEDWVLAERSRLESCAHEAMRQAVRLLAKRNELRPALEIALRAAELVPLHEANCRDIMRLQAALGRAREALTTYRDFTQRLREELRTSPSPATIALAEELTRSTTADTLTPPASPPQPAALDSFFGREHERQTFAAWLREAKGSPESAALITLTGMGGTGKTRLAKELARDSTELFGPHIHFFSLADETDPARLFETLCIALRLPRTAETLPLEQLAGVLGNAPTLLILDNFEQLVAGGDAQIQALRERVPNLTLLITSRLRLNVAGEREFALRPLPVPLPDDGELLPLADFACIRLFIARCRQYQSDFMLTPENAETIAQICARLEGLPLALELAAAWSRLLTPQQMLARLQKRFDLLVSTRRDLPDRHRSLRATIEGSYRLLPPEQRAFFAQLAVFAGGWDLDAAQAVCGANALAMLAALQDASLVVTERDADAMFRFRLLETLREFAAEQLTDTERRETQARFIAYFTGLAEQGHSVMQRREGRQWHRRLAAEHDNFRAALALCFAQSDLPASAAYRARESGIRLTIALMGFWSIRGYLPERERWQAVAYAAAESVTPELRAALYMEIADGNPAAVDTAFSEKAMELGEDLHHLPLMARAKLLTGNTFHAAQDYAHSLHCIGEALTLLQNAARPDLLGYALNQRAICYCHLDRTDAQAAFDEAITTLRQANTPYILTKSLFDAAFFVSGPGARERAEALLEEALAVCAALDFQGGRAHGLWILGKVVRGRDIERAEACFHESLALHRQYGFMHSTSLPLFELGYTALLRGEYAKARKFFLECYANRSPSDMEDRHRMLMWCALGAGDTPEFDRCCTAHLRTMRDTDAAMQEVLAMQIFAAEQAGNFGAARRLYPKLAALWRQNPSLTAPHVLYLAAAHGTAAAGQAEDAARLHGAEASFRAEHRMFRLPQEAFLLARTEALIRIGLPAEEHAACYAEGKAMDADTRRSLLHFVCENASDSSAI